MATLSDLVQALPSELINKIYTLTFTPTATLPSIGTQHLHNRLVNKRYKPPPCLQVNRSLRANLAQSYYSTSSFWVSVDDCWNWLDSLPEPHSRMLGEIRLLDWCVEVPAGGDLWEAIRGELVVIGLYLMKERDFGRPGLFRFEYVYVESGERRWMGCRYAWDHFRVLAEGEGRLNL